MAELNVLPQNQVIRLVAQADKREFTLFLGAGASYSSGVPLASEMIREWRQMAFEDRAPRGADFEAWCKEQSWYGKDEEYSLLFEMLFPNERARQKYVEPKIEAGFPSWCYLYLANIIYAGYFNVIFTTNFDDLVNDALTMYLGYNPVVCAADSEVISINIATERAKIIKLHGDYLFKRLKNTVQDLDQLDPNMESKFREFAKQCGVVVIGYSGRDRSVMRVFEELLKDPETFPNGIYWAVRSSDTPAPRVQALRETHPKRFHLFRCEDFDTFIARLHATYKLNLPQTVLQPYESLHNKFLRLVGKATKSQLNDELINAHITQLKEQLDRPWAKTTDLSEFDLLQAQLALGQRDYKAAIDYVSKYHQQHPDDAAALTTWGDALAVQAEEEHSEAAAQEATAKWKEAIRLNPQLLPPHYSLARYYARVQKTAEAIEAGEALLKLVPGDGMVRRSLISLYAASGRQDDALRELEFMLGREPHAADLHAMKAAVLEQRGLIVESLDALKRAVELQPQNAWFRFSLANSYARLGRMDEAQQEFEQAIQLDARNLAYRLQVANFLWARQQPAQALPHLEAAVQIEPNSAEAHGWLGQIYLSQGRFAEAQRAMDTALRLSPNDSRLLVNAGILYSHLNRPDMAENYFNRAISANPSIPQPYYLLCLIYWMQNRVMEFQRAFQSLARIAPTVAQQLQMQLQAMQMQFGGNRQAALQAQWLGWLQNQPQSAPQPTWGAPSGQNEPSATDLLRAAWSKLSGSAGG